MCPPPAQINSGAFLPTTSVFDVSVIYSTDVNSPEFKELIVRLQQNINAIALNVNIRDAGYYPLTEFVNGQIFFPDPTLTSSTSQTPQWRQVFRKVINFGPLPNNTTKSIAHGVAIGNTYSFTRIYGASTDQVAHKGVTLPYSSTAGDNIELYVDGTNVNVTTNSDWSAYTKTYIVLEYITT